MKEVELISVIRTRLSTRGSGVKEDPVRVITQYWDLEGNLLWEEPDKYEWKAEFGPMGDPNNPFPLNRNDKQEDEVKK